MKRLFQWALLVSLSCPTTPLSAAGTAPAPSRVAPGGWCAEAAAKALASLSSRPPSDTNALMEALIETGASLELAGEAADASRLYGQAVRLARGQVRITGINPDPPLRAYIKALIHLGGLEYSNSRYEEAERLCRIAVEAARIRLPEGDPLVKVTRNRLALALGQRYQPEKREAFYLALKDSCVKAFGPRHEETLLVLDELVKIKMMQADYKQAALFAQEALRARRSTLRTDHPLVADSINHLASARYSLGQRADLVPLLREALKIRVAAFGPEHPKTELARKNLEAALVK